MEIKIVDNIAETDIKADVLILPFTEDYKGAVYSKLDEQTGSLIKRVFETKEFTGKHAELTLIHTTTGRVVLVGLGKAADITSEKLRRAGGKVFFSKYLKAANVSSAALSTAVLRELGQLKGAKYAPAFYFVEGVLLSRYEFKRYKKPEKEQRADIKTLTVLGSGAFGNSDGSIKWLDTVVPASSFARDLVNTPSSDMTPAILAETAKSLAGKRVKVKVLDAEAAKKEGMWSYLSVAKGSEEPPKFIVIEYKGGKGAPVAIIGKSITFDSGGISLKPADGMEKMKYDMAGGAAALGIVKAVSALALPINLIAVLPTTENMPGGNATRPGDVVTAITGKTIEILNTDAEGRLVLADAIGYAIKHYKPAVIIDMATLTGACSIALGNEAIAMMGNNEALMDNLKKASAETYERVWQMPLYEEYKDYLKSDIADIKNIGGRTGGLVTAAYFLSEFVDDTPWVHLDIASTANADKDKPYICKGATGIGVRLIMSYLLNYD
ncbi:leucyl aminopeptidase [Candidatus Magnetominusculus dajiuhuensis]|uniref:leucyl aminopeptidase n=1 Tax=Candidatus Magnetominusculus dajiuhuensis TaxID=3137712 RepID=UPI003B428F39